VNRLTRFLILLTLGWAAWGQTPTYPTGVVTDSQITVAANNVQTTTTAFMGASDTSFTVSSGSQLAANMLLTVDSTEIVHVCQVTSNTVKVGVSSCPNIDGRGFDGTTAVTHNAQSSVSANTDAWHHNAVRVELEAIETALGANLANVATGANVTSAINSATTSITSAYTAAIAAAISGIPSPTLPFKVSSDYNFAPITSGAGVSVSGGALIAGTNVLTFATVPPGINGTNANDALYVAGTGTPESCLITGGSGTAGQTNGQIIVSCAGSHSAGWTIRSATAGIQEAIDALPGGGGQVVVPAGTWTCYSTITIATSGISLRGVSRQGTTISTAYVAGPLISAPNVTGAITISDLSLTGPSTGSSFAISLVNQAELTAEHLAISGFGQGISNTGNTNTQLSVFRDIEITGITGDGVLINTTIDGGTWENIIVGSGASGSNGFQIIAGVGIRFVNTYTNGAGVGLAITPGAGQTVGVLELVGAYFDGYQSYCQYGIGIAPTGGGIVNSITSVEGGMSGFNYGLNIFGTGTIEDLVFNGTYITNNNSTGVQLGVSTLTIKNLLFSDCLVEGNSVASSGAAPGLNAQYVTNLVIRGGVYAAGSFGGGLNTQSAGIIIGGSVTTALIDGAVVAPNVSSPIIVGGSSNTGIVIKNAIGYNPVGQSAISIGAGPTFSYVSGYSDETLYIQGGTISGVQYAGHTIANTSPATGQSIVVPMAPNTALLLTFSGSPTVFRDVH